MPGAVNPPTKIRLNREKLAAGPAEDTGSRAIGPIVQELRTVRPVPLKELLGDSVVGHEVSRVTNNDPTSVQERRIGDIDVGMLDSEGEQSDQKSGASSYATAIYAPPASAHVVPAVVAIARSFERVSASEEMPRPRFETGMISDSEADFGDPLSLPHASKRITSTMEVDRDLFNNPILTSRAGGALSIFASRENHTPRPARPPRIDFIDPAADYDLVEGVKSMQVDSGESGDDEGGESSDDESTDDEDSDNESSDGEDSDSSEDEDSSDESRESSEDEDSSDTDDEEPEVDSDHSGAEDRRRLQELLFSAGTRISGRMNEPIEGQDLAPVLMYMAHKEKAQEKAIQKAKAKAKAKAERKAKRKAERKAKRKAKRDAKRKAKKEAKRRAKKEAKRKAEVTKGLEKKSVSDEELILKRSIRSFTMNAMQRKRNSSPFLTPPTPTEVEQFADSGLNGPSLRKLNFDVTGYSPNSNWNKECASILASLYVESKQAIEKNQAKVAAAIMRHIPALVQQYKKLHPSEDPEVIAKTKAEVIENNRRVRRRNLGHRRLATTKSYPSLHSLYPLLRGLPSEAMSGDETDTGRGRVEGRPQYKIVRQMWRSKEFTTFLRVLDILHRRDRTTLAGKPTAGSLPRLRVSSEQKEDNAPPSLPEYCYDKGWLSRQTPDAKRRLAIGKSVLNAKDVFEIPPDIQEIVVEYQKITAAAQSFSPNAVELDVRTPKKASSKKSGSKKSSSKKPSSKKQSSKAVDRAATPTASGSRK